MSDSQYHSTHNHSKFRTICPLKFTGSGLARIVWLKLVMKVEMKLSNFHLSMSALVHWLLLRINDTLELFQRIIKILPGLFSIRTCADLVIL